MEKNICTHCTELINGPLKSIIEKAILNHFGVTVNINATTHKGGWDGYYITVEDILGTDVSKKMMPNKLLRSLFYNTTLYGHVWYTEKNDTIGIRFSVNYHHPVGEGSNGHEVGTLYINATTGKCRWYKYPKIGF